MNEDEQSLIPRLQRAYRQLRKSRLVKKTDPRQTDDEALEHFVSILNAALPRPGDPAEELADKLIKLQYFSNPRGYIRGLHRKNTEKNARKDARCLILLTIGLEIVREFELEKVIHLHWNNEAREYDIEATVGNTRPSPVRDATRIRRQPAQETNEVGELEEKVRRLEAEMARLTSGGTSEPEEDLDETTTEVEVDETSKKSWADMANE
jgi:hypothetical protein